MPLPETLVTVRALRFEGLPASLDTASSAYARVTIGARVFGRSRRISASGTFDLAAEREVWEMPLALPPGATVPIGFAVVDDLDTGPGSLVTGSSTLSGPFADGEVEIVSGATKLVVSLGVVGVRRASAPAHVARSPSPASPGAVLRPPSSIVLTFQTIRGLHKPGHAPVGLGRPLRRAEHDPTYLSEDDRGRIFSDANLDGSWHRDRQQIELDVAVSAVGVSLGGSKVLWTILDPDDPFNDRSDVHREAGRYIDPNDYDASGAHLGALGNDNTRAYNEAGTGGLPQIFDRLPPWEALAGFAVSDVTNTSCKTALDASGASKLRLHCPDVGGTNLIVRAEIDPVPSGTAVIPAQTGIMTIWKRIDVEVVRMDGAFALPAARIQSIAEEFEHAFVQLDFWPESVTAATPALAPVHLAPNRRTLTDRSAAWVRSVFSHRNDPGWFFFGIAKRGYPPPPDGSPLFDSATPGSTWSHGSSGGAEYIEVNQRITATVGAVRISWKHPEPGGGLRDVKLSWDLYGRTYTASSTRYWLVPHDVTSRFTGHDADGSHAHAHASQHDFYPVSVRDAAGTVLAGRSYDVPVSGPSQARIELLPGEVGEVSGISPGPSGLFAGQTIVFSYHRRFANHGTPAAPNVPPLELPAFAAQTPRTVTHEFAHAFGMPHKCGFDDFRTPRATSCCMNYFTHWLLVPGSTVELKPFTENKMAASLCGRHLMEIRRVHLKRNRALNWR